MVNNQEITKEVKEEIKKIPRKIWQWKYDDPIPMWCYKSSSKREVYSNTILPQESSQLNNLTLHQKQLDKEEQKTPKVSRRKEIIKIR